MYVQDDMYKCTMYVQDDMYKCVAKNILLQLQVLSAVVPLKTQIENGELAPSKVLQEDIESIARKIIFEYRANAKLKNFISKLPLIWDVAPSQDVPSQDAPSQDAPFQDAPFQDAPSQDAPSQDAPSQDAPSQDSICNILQKKQVIYL